jgi:hypothetical protein
MLPMLASLTAWHYADTREALLVIVGGMLLTMGRDIDNHSGLISFKNS